MVKEKCLSRAILEPSSPSTNTHHKQLWRAVRAAQNGRLAMASGLEIR